MKHLFTDRVHRLPRIWSNNELKKFAHMFEGDIVNVSAWRDEDKQGSHYEDYFTNSTSYSRTNFKAEANGLQGTDNEIFLDLGKTLPPDLKSKFDVVFNHTTLEHIFETDTAFENLCQMSKDIVITIVPFVQQYHSHYGDFWRFTPELIKRLYEKNDFELVYQSFNNHKSASVYIFSIASRTPSKWKGKIIDWEFSCLDPKPVIQEPYAGCHAIPNPRYRAIMWAKRVIKSILRVDK